MKITSYITGKPLYEGEAETLSQLVATAVKARACLRGADLGGAYLRGAYLGGADLRGAYLRGAYLGGADLRGAYLGGADLGGAYLRGADLRGAYLRGADLRGAYLGGAYLGDFHFLGFQGIGSAKRDTLYWLEADKVYCGCFTGTLAEFEAQIQETHEGNPRFLADYTAGLTFLKSCIALIPKEEVEAGAKQYAEMPAESERIRAEIKAQQEKVAP